MPLVPVRSLLGIGSIPRDRTAARKWLISNGVPVTVLAGDGRRPEAILLSDLPTEVRRAYELREIENAGLPAGEYDDVVHSRFAEATPAMQATALRKAEIARFLVKGGATSKRLPGLLCDAAREAFGPEGTVVPADTGVA